MKQLKRTLALLVVVLFTAIGASAADLLSPGWQELSNYTEDFSSAKVSSSKFTALPDYWSVVGTGAVWGVSSGYITCANDQTSNTTDYLVTPKVKGDISVKARYSYWAASTGGSGYGHITVYEAVANGDSYTKGNVVFDQALGDYSSFTKFTIASGSTEYKQYMIHLSGAYMDDFAASSAYVNVPTVRVLTPTAITGEWSDSNPIYANAAGEGTWTGTITVKNEGNVALNPGDENFSLAVASQSAWAVSTTMTTFAIPEALAVGEEKTFDVSVPVKLVDATADGRTAIRLTTNLLADGNTATSSASYKQSSWFTLKTQAPKLYVKNASGSNVESYETVLGLVSAPASTTFTLKNEGGSAVVLKSIASTFENAAWTVDDAAVAFPYTIAKGESKTFTLTLNATGGQSSTLTFNYGNTYDDVEYSVESKTVSAVVADPSLYLENFTGQLTVPAEWCQPGWINETGSTWSFKSSSSNTYAESSTQTMQDKYLISPKLTFTEGQTLTVSAVPGSTSTYSSNQTFLKVLYSTDRVNWEVAKVIAFADTRDAVKDYEDKFMEWGSFGGTTIAYAKPFVIDGIPAGDYYIGFESGYSKIDYVFGGVLAELDNDFYINSVKVEAEKSGMVNYPVTVTVNYSNMNKEASKAHKVVLLDGETVIAEEEVASIAAYTAAEPVVFTFTPHEAATLNLQVKVLVEEDSYEAASDVIEKVIKEESAEAEKQVGAKTGMTNTAIGQNYNRYRTEWILKADDLGLANGTEITSLTLKYYNTSKDLAKKAKIFLMSTDDAEVSGTAFTPVDKLTPNYSNDEYVMAKAGSNTDPAEMKFIFDAPYTYDGKNIRVVTDFNGSNYASVYFETAAGKSLYYKADGSADTHDKNSATSSSLVPVVYLGYSVTVPTLTGTVTAGGNAVEGVDVTVVSGNVEYYATTDAEGNFSTDIYQSDKDYMILVDAIYGYDKAKEEASLESNNVIELVQHTITLPETINKYKYTTLYDSKYDMAIPAGVKAYVAEQVASDELAYTEITGYIPANTGVLLYAPSALTDFDVKALTEVPEEKLEYSSVFFGYDEETTPEAANGSYYKLQYSPSDRKIGFYYGAENGAPFLCKAHKAYLFVEVLRPLAPAFFGLPGDDATGISNVKSNANANSRYSINGQKVNANYRGIVIENGKKVLVK